MCFHINLNESNAKALIYQNDFDEDYGDYFLDFVEMKDFKDLGIDETFVNIDTCSRFTYLTRSIKRYKDKDKLKKLNDETEYGEYTGRSHYFYKVWINVMIIDPYNRIPQVALFKSSKVFHLYDEETAIDIMQRALLFKIDDNLHMIA